MLVWGFVMICALLILVPVLVNMVNEPRGDERGSEQGRNGGVPGDRNKVLARATRRRPSTSQDRAA
jgi:hypothetical protein